MVGGGGWPFIYFSLFLFFLFSVCVVVCFSFLLLNFLLPPLSQIQ
jgi:hypothetical protein